MKTTFLKFTAIVCSFAFSALSCDVSVPEHVDDAQELHTCEMTLNGGITPFDAIGTKGSGDSGNWINGSTIYLRMNSPIGATLGKAVYNSSTQKWVLSYYGSLHEGVANACTAIYVEGDFVEENNVLKLNEYSSIFEDTEGTYLFADGELYVTANLTPKTGRLRMSGKNGQIIKVYGISRYSNFDLGTYLFTTEAAAFKVKVQDNGFTPYVYGFFTEEDEPCLRLWIDAKEAYTRFLSKDIFAAGKSGKLTVPTNTSHVGWDSGLIFTCKDYRFKMIAVEGGTFAMGSNSISNAQPVHQVTLSGYCIAETELTEKLYRIAMNQSSSSYPLYPITNLAWSQCSTICSNLSNKIKMATFVLPSEAQWEFAAIGGIHSKGYKYSGSDNADDVSWHSENSNNGYRNVKTKLPNELGIYDMTGNAWEFVEDTYDTYLSNAQVDPVIILPNIMYRVSRGGACTTSRTSSNLSPRNRASNYYSSNISNCGMRLALNWN